MRRLALLWLLASCATVPEPLAEPPLLLVAVPVPPAWLAGLLPPAPAGSAPAPARGFQLRVIAFAVREAPIGRLVQDAATVITATGGTPFPGGSTSLLTCRMLSGAEASAWSREAAQRPAFEVQELGQAIAVIDPDLAARFASDRLRFPFTLATNGNTIQLVLQSNDGDLLEVAAELTRTGDTTILWMPAVEDQSVRFAFSIENTGEAPAESVAAAKAAANAATPTAVAQKPSDTIERQLALAKAAIGERNRRPALLALTRRLGLPDLEDALLCADEAALISIANGLPEAGALPPGAEASWALAREMWRALTAILQRDSANPGLRACLLRHLGAVYYDPTTLERLVQAQPGPEAFQTALREENMTALGDRSTASRVRANEWLAANGIVVPGYDPLADLASRQQALRTHAAVTAAEAAAEGAAEAHR